MADGSGFPRHGFPCIVVVGERRQFSQCELYVSQRRILRPDAIIGWCQLGEHPDSLMTALVDGDAAYPRGIHDYTANAAGAEHIALESNQVGILARLQGAKIALQEGLPSRIDGHRTESLHDGNLLLCANDAATSGYPIHRAPNKQ